jgi:hypothetical protein
MVSFMIFTASVRNILDTTIVCVAAANMLMSVTDIYIYICVCVRARARACVSCVF